MKVIAHDFETTGVDPKTCGVVQLALVRAVLAEDGDFHLVDQHVGTYHPGCPIPPGASQVHGITDDVVAGAPRFDVAIPPLYEQATLDQHGELTIGYNSVAFDNLIAARLGHVCRRSLDVYTAVRRAKTQGWIENARLGSAHRHYLGEELIGAHDALADVIATLRLIRPLMAQFKIDRVSDFIDWTNRPLANAGMEMPFGKHKGTPLREIPTGYLGWMLKNLTLDPDLKASVQAAKMGA